MSEVQQPFAVIFDFIAEYLAKRAGIERAAIAPDEHFQRLGLDSLGATGLLVELGHRLGRPLSPTLVWEYPTPAALAQYLCAGPPGQEPQPAAAVGQSSADREPIAITGMACRFPSARNLQEFWSLLRGGGDAITEVPKDRWDIDALYDPDASVPGKMSSRWGGFLEDVRTFDAAFFGISPREAAQIDPQQRLALELAWEALEDAGTAAASLRGGRCGVFVGVIWHDYADLLLRAGAPVELHTGTGQSLSIVANRISYALGLQGPSLAIDTACSSSLVAIHLACKSLRDGESSLALVGGVNLMLTPHTSEVLSKFGGLSPRGRCRAFDAAADGFVRGEGGGFVVLKPLSRALAEGDRIYCVIRGSAVNNDGASNGLTAPNPAAQRAVLAEACQRAGVLPQEVDYVEAHGTGTRLGDPIEAAALGAVLGAQRPPEQPLRVGSVKTNIGHQEGAAGIAGLIKAALAIQHRQIPPSLHFAEANPLIPFSDLHLEVVTKLQSWPSPRPALAGISSFGWGGTNCHVLLAGLDAATSQLALLGAEDEAGLRAAAATLAEQALDPSRPLPDLCPPGTGSGRHRLAVLAKTRSGLGEQAHRWLHGQPVASCRSFVAPAGQRRLALVFSPQGGQWRGMATQLLRVSSGFRQTLTACDAAISRHGGWSLLKELHAPGPHAGTTAIIQPSLFAVQAALAAELGAQGVCPDVVVGHSLGEITAAYVSGALSLDDAARVVVHYSRLQARTAGDGGMALVQLPLPEASALIEPFAGDVCVAGDNGPSTTLVSGRPAALDQIVSQLSGRGIFAARIDVNIAAHGPQMDPILDELRAALVDLQPRACRIPMWSTSTCGLVAGHTLDGAWFAHNLRSPVRFAEAIRALSAGGTDLFVEVNPHPILLPSIQEGLAAAGAGGFACGTLLRGGDEQQALLDTIGRLWVHGAALGPKGAGAALQPEPAAALPQLVVLSARSEAALTAQAARLREHLQSHEELALADLAYSLATTRSPLEHRLALVAASREGLDAALGAAAQGQTPPAAVRGRVSAAPARLAFLFTGQGAQVPGMGRGLYAAWPVFRAAFDRCLRLFDQELPRSLQAVMWSPADSAESALLHQTAYTQPALFALEYSLSALWQSWGIRPDLLAGHSIGELVAACVAGVFTLEDAVRLCAARGRLMQALPAGGAMATIAASEATVAAALAACSAAVAIAAVNGPQQVVISGDEAKVAALVSELAGRGVRTRILKVSHAFHSPLMEPMLAEFRQVAESIRYRAPAIPIVSNLTGQLGADLLCSADYWVQHVRQAVRFADGVQALGAAHVRTFVELGPKSTLLGLIPACLPDADVVLVPSLHAERSEPESALAALGGLWGQGGSVDWKGVFPGGGLRVELPSYAFERQLYWVQGVAQPEDPLTDWFYQLEWPEQPRSPAPTLSGEGRWLILSDQTGVGPQLEAALHGRGRSPILIAAAVDAATLGGYLARPASWEGVVYLGGLDASSDELTPAAEVAARAQRAIVPVLALIKGLADASSSARLWIVTRGACPVDQQAGTACGQATLWGLGRAAAVEHPAAWGGLVDLDPQQSATDVDALVTELLAPDAEDQIAFRRRRRHVARLTAARPPAASAPWTVSAEGAYLVTGGLGGIGLQLARWLVARGARHLILTSRHGLPDRSEWQRDQANEVRQRIAAIAELEAQGVQVTVAAVDVADIEQMKALLAASAPPLRGVVHAAGVLSDGLLSHQDAARLQAVLRPKVEGAWVLHQLTRQQPLDFFVLFSSIATTLGLVGNGVYAAANAFLDALAASRQAQALPALSIAWGLWAEGMGERSRPALFAELGARAMPPALALSALQRLLGSGMSQCLVAAMDWRKFAATLPPGGRHGQLLQPLLGKGADPALRAVEPPAQPDPPGPAAIADLAQLVRTSVAQVLGVAAAESIHPHQLFAEMGMDSLMAVQLHRRLQRALGVPLATTLAFDHPTVERLALHLRRDVLQGASQQRPAEVTAAQPDEPIAIVGLACRFPGEGSDPEAVWRLLQQQAVVAAPVPASRWSPADWYDPSPEAPFRTSVARGGFLAEVEQFDAGFFHISPLEVISMDPQQRLLLEVSWEALERSRQDPAALRQTKTGVFVGAGANEYAERLQDLDDQAAARYAGTGNLPSVLAGRLSYFLGLHGPSLFVDTACSSSLVALHLACQSIRQGECEAALVGGVNLLLSPASFVMMSQLRALSPDGRCKTFAADADGYGRSEGCAVVVLKRLRDAERDGSPILGLIRGTAINHDGASNGLTAPSGPAQQAVLRQALHNAGVAPAEVDYVECHGTGTQLGDPIEVQALAAVYGAGRAPGQPLILGAVKANLGHLEAASGLAGLVKVVLALQHQEIPPQPSLGELNPHIPWPELPVSVARQAQPWPRGRRPRRAAVSSFGISGTNAHAVLEEPPPAKLPAAAPERSAELVLLSARTEAALLAQAARLHAHLQSHPEQRLGDLAYSLVHTRSAMDCRLAIAATSPTELAAALAGAAGGQLPASVVRGQVGSAAPGRVIFVFPGQGSQWLGMGRGLLAEEPVFRAAMTACDRAIHNEAGFSVLAELAADEASSQLQRVDVVQPVLFALGVALSALWRSWGVVPDVVVGHSLGEVAAAHVAGALSLEDAVAIICRRSRLLRRISGQGAMALVELPLGQALAELAEYPDRLSVAVSNSPRSTVISGEPAALAAVTAKLELRGVFCRRVNVDVASHSPQVEPLLAELRGLLSDLRPRKCLIPMRSTVTAQEVLGPELGAEYWADNLRQPVRFCEVMQVLLGSGPGLSLELSAHPVLVSAVEELLQTKSPDGAALGSLRRGQAERAALLTSLGALWVRGYPVQPSQQFPAGGRDLDLPTYPWQRQRYWVDRQLWPAGSLVRAHAGGHPLLGPRQALSTLAQANLWESTLELKQLPWLRDHRVQGAVVFPGAGYLEMALACGHQLFGAEPFEVAEVSLVEALGLTGEAPVQLQVVTTEEQPGRLRFQLASPESRQGPATFRVHARGVLRRSKRSEAPSTLDLKLLRERLPTSVEPAQSYAGMAALGMEYGPAFQGIHQLWCGDGEALGRIELPAGAHPERYQFHPTLLDSCFQVIVEASGPERGNSPWLPVQIGAIQLFSRPPAEVFCHVRLAPPDPASADRRRADLCVVAPSGAVVAEIKDLVVQRRASSEPRDEQDSWYLAVEWQPSPVPAPSVSAGRWLLLGDGGPLGGALREALQSAGHSVVQGESLLPNSTALRALLTDSFGDKAPTAVVHLGRVGVEGATDSNIAEKALLQGCDNVLHVVQALVGMWYREAPRLWLFSRGAQAATEGPVALTQAPLLGLGRTIAVEHPELRCVRLDLDPGRPEGEAQAVLAELLADDAEDEVALRGRERLVARIVRRLPEAEQPERRERAAGRPFRLASEKPGVLDRLTLRTQVRRPPGPGEVEIAVEAAGLNFADVLAALGIRPGSQGRPVMLGGECAGRIVAVGPGVEGIAVGQDVLAVAPGSFSTHVTVSSRMVVPRPAHLSAAQAAALPVAYMTAWYGLVHLGRLRAGERVLIHSATGGTGFAAVRIARHLGAEIFATAGTEQKRQWLRAQGVSQVMDSRSLDFSAQVLAATHGEGVDLVLNSLSGPAIEASLATLGQDGRFIELGKTDIYSDRALGLSPFKKSLSYSAVDMASLGERRPERFGALLAETMALVGSGVLPPLPVTTVPISAAVDAFRTMAQAQHIGKLVLTMADPDDAIRVTAPAKVTVRSDSSYLVTGGLGGLGLVVAEWLGKLGAGHLILMGRAGDVSFEQRTVVSALAARGTRVSIAKGNVANRAQMEQILADIQSSGMPLRGIVHAAGSLDDGVIMQQTPLRFRTVMAPKVQGAWHLHELTRKLPLDFFVMYSSAAGLLGSPGQANYAAANTFLDALAHHRRALGLPALSIDWGAFSEVGLAAAQDNRGARLASRGMHSMTPEQGIEALGRLLAGGQVQMGVVPIDIRQWGASHRAAAVSRRLSRLQTERRGEPRREQEAQELLVRLAAAQPAARTSMLTEILLTQLAQVLRLPESQIARSVPLTALGLDSLMGLELRNRIESVLGIRVPASLLWTHLTVGGVAEYIDQEIRKSEPSARQSAGSDPTAPKLTLATPDSKYLAKDAGSQGASRGVAIVRLHTAPAPKLHLVCFPPGGGGPELFLRWTTKLPDAVSISCLHLPGRGARLSETPYVDMKQLLAGICDELVGILKSDTPVAFFGHSLGSIVSFETAQQLLRLHGVSPLHLFVSACSSPRRGVELEHHLGFGKASASGTFSTDTLSDAELVGILRRAGALGRGAEKLDDEELAAFFVPSLRTDLKVLRSYTHEASRTLPIPLTAIIGRQDPMVDANRIAEWMKHTSQSFAAHIIQGDHGIRYEQLWGIISATLASLLQVPAEP
jgi:acyl transferase domain-containing protein/surfactin synthase thioesterase subunit/D-arabinose 1-dehydrogenase-like Zn-dependent alcohol dehydrogenase/acyl carrier protein